MLFDDLDRACYESYWIPFRALMMAASAKESAAASESAIVVEDGWSFSSIVFLLVLVGAAFAFWRYNGAQYVKLLVSGRSRAEYRRVSDIETARY